AKKITPAPRATPDQPNAPNWPRLGGTNGCQLDAAMDGWRKRYAATTAMNVSTVATFTNTIAELKLADSRIPTTRIAVTTAITRYAGRSLIPTGWGREVGSIPACWRAGPIVASRDQTPW